MARDTAFSQDLAALAAEDRSRLGDLPTAEQLIALRDGGLPEEEADRLRDRLAVDPELAALYLDLQRWPELEAAAEIAEETDNGVDEAWLELSARLDAESPVAVEPALERRDGVPFRRTAGRVLLPLAAALILSAGLVWLLTTRGDPEPLPTGEYFIVRATGEPFRDARIRIPEGYVGLEFIVPTPDVDPSQGLLVEMLDASDIVVRQERKAVRSGEPEFAFRVASSSLRGGWTFRLFVREPDALRTGEPVVTFIPVFEGPHD